MKRIKQNVFERQADRYTDRQSERKRVVETENDTRCTRMIELMLSN